MVIESDVQARTNTGSLRQIISDTRRCSLLLFIKDWLGGLRFGVFPKVLRAERPESGCPIRSPGQRLDQLDWEFLDERLFAIDRLELLVFIL